MCNHLYAHQIARVIECAYEAKTAHGAIRVLHMNLQNQCLDVDHAAKKMFYKLQVENVFFLIIILLSIERVIKIYSNGMNVCLM